MFWDKKDDKGLPDLPQPTISPPPMANEETEEEETFEKHGLPSFPDSPIQKGFSQTAIKDAITNSDVEEEETVGIPRTDKSIRTVEIEEWSHDKEFAPSLSSQSQSLVPPMKKEMQMPQASSIAPASAAMSTAMPSTTAKPAKGSDVFVKIDKFYSAKKALESASSKLDEIDELLKRIRETKLREEQELSSWEKEVATIKARIKDVTDNVFEKA